MACAGKRSPRAPSCRNSARRGGIISRNSIFRRCGSLPRLFFYFNLFRRCGQAFFRVFPSVFAVGSAFPPPYACFRGVGSVEGVCCAGTMAFGIYAVSVQIIRLSSFILCLIILFCIKLTCPEKAEKKKKSFVMFGPQMIPL